MCATPGSIRSDSRQGDGAVNLFPLGATVGSRLRAATVTGDKRVPTVGSVIELRRYPVKSLAGETLTVAVFDRRGLDGDLQTRRAGAHCRDLLRLPALVRGRW
jgi:hypothetical protein